MINTDIQKDPQKPQAHLVRMLAGRGQTKEMIGAHFDMLPKEFDMAFNQQPELGRAYELGQLDFKSYVQQDFFADHSHEALALKVKIYLQPQGKANVLLRESVGGQRFQRAWDILTKYGKSPIPFDDYGFQNRVLGFGKRIIAGTTATDNYGKNVPAPAPIHKTRGQVCGVNAVLVDTRQLLGDDAVLGGSGNIESLFKVPGLTKVKQHRIYMSITINLSDIVSKHRARLNQQQSKSPKKIKQQYSNTQQEALPILNTNDPLEKALHKWNKAIIWRDGMRDEFAKRAARAYRTS